MKAKPDPESEKTTRILTWLLSPLFLAGGCFLWWFYMDALILSIRASYFWQDVEIRVDNAELEKRNASPHSRGISRPVELTDIEGSYVYSVNGVSYSGERWLVMRGSSNMDEAAKRKVVDRARSGRMTARVNLKNATESVVEPSFLPGVGAVSGILAVLFGLIGFGWLSSLFGKRGGFVLISLYFLFSALALFTGALLSFLHLGLSFGGIVLFLFSAPFFYAVSKSRPQAEAEKI